MVKKGQNGGPLGLILRIWQGNVGEIEWDGHELTKNECVRGLKNLTPRNYLTCPLAAERDTTKLRG